MTIVVNDLLDENDGEDEYVEESDDDLRAEMDQDDELRILCLDQTLMMRISP